MKSFKLKNKKEEQETLEQQKKETEENAKNKNLNFIQKNPQTVGAIILGFITYFFIILNVSFVWVVPIIYGARRLLKAKKIGENKKFITIGYVVVYSPILWILLGVSFFVINALYFKLNQLNNYK